MKDKVIFYCEKCKLKDQDKLLDKSRSNDNWAVAKKKCPKCGGAIRFGLKKSE